MKEIEKYIILGMDCYGLYSYYIGNYKWSDAITEASLYNTYDDALNTGENIKNHDNSYLYIRKVIVIHGKIKQLVPGYMIESKRKNKMNITLNGDLGSGKSTVRKLLVKEGFADISIGNIMREMAKQANMSIEQFGYIANNNPDIDRQIDDELVRLSKLNDKAVFDSRLAWHFIPDSFKVYIAVNIDTAAVRVFNDNRENEKFNSVEEAKKSLLNRRKLENERYSAEYNVNMLDMTNYDFVIDSTNITPEEVAEKILSEYTKFMNN